MQAPYLKPGKYTIKKEITHQILGPAEADHSKDLDYYNFLHQCAKNSSSVQWLWSTPDKIIVTKLTQKFPRLDPKILQKFCKNLSYIKKEKNKKNSEKNLLAIIYYLKKQKDIDKKLQHSLGLCTTYNDNKKAIKIFINYPYGQKNNSLTKTKKHELSHVKFYYGCQHNPDLDSLLFYKSTKKLKNDYSLIARNIFNRLDELFKNEFIAYNSWTPNFQLIIDHQVLQFIDENYIRLLYQKFHRSKKIRDRKKQFLKYYDIYLKIIKLRPLYLYLSYYHLNHLKKKYPRNYHEHFFNLLVPYNSAEFIHSQDKKLIKKYKIEQKKFVAQFIKKVNTIEKKYPDSDNSQEVYRKLLTDNTFFKLHLFNSPKLLKPLILIFCVFGYTENHLDEASLNQLFDLIMKSYHYNNQKIKKEFKSIIIKILKIKKRHLPSDEFFSLSYLKNALDLMKNNYL